MPAAVTQQQQQKQTSSRFRAPLPISSLHAPCGVGLSNIYCSRCSTNARSGSSSCCWKERQQAACCCRDRCIPCCCCSCISCAVSDSRDIQNRGIGSAKPFATTCSNSSSSSRSSRSNIYIYIYIGDTKQTKGDTEEETKGDSKQTSIRICFREFKKTDGSVAKPFLAKQQNACDSCRSPLPAAAAAAAIAAAVAATEALV